MQQITSGRCGKHSVQKPCTYFIPCLPQQGTETLR